MAEELKDRKLKYLLIGYPIHIPPAASFYGGRGDRNRRNLTIPMNTSSMLEQRAERYDTANQMLQMLESVMWLQRADA